MKILIAEDEEITLKHLTYALEQEGYIVTGVQNGLSAAEKLEERNFDLLIADIKMPGMDGLSLLEKTRELYPDLDVIIVTGFGSIESAVNAMKIGATEYITKPFNLDELSIKIRKILEKKRLERENIALKVTLGTDHEMPIVARSRPMKRLLEVVNSITGSDCNVLITGESGVGKGLISKLIHYTGPRKERPFLSINCAIFTEELLASELFGHERGSFTGAVSSKKGLLEIAHGGTVFLDEIAEMTPALQAKLLKVIEDKEFLRVGGTRAIHVNVRFIAATNQNIKTLIQDGRFREDLYYRLNVMDIHIPPLRERKDDISPLAKHFLSVYAAKENKKITGISKDAQDLLHSYTFPGNVRELENIIERAVILEKSPLITPDNLPHGIKLYEIEAIDPNRIRTIDEISRNYVEKVLELMEGNKSKAADVLGISRTSLWRILNR